MNNHSVQFHQALRYLLHSPSLWSARCAADLDESDPESGGAGGSEASDQAPIYGCAAARGVSDDSDSAESAGPSGDEGEDAPSEGGQDHGDNAKSPEIAGASREELEGIQLGVRGSSRVPRNTVFSDQLDDDDTAFSDGEEAPLMSAAAVAAATEGLDEPSSEDEDDEPEEGGMLADVDNSGEDSDAAPEGVQTEKPR